ncbi:gamma-butyrobetaine hydroxylase-like domain-containing protein [Parendozoicomonas haliclonae]|uniref:Gamma-butyrobetaine hydroxylase-like N-terminal domain-containing protein n=1 Tax=Parendozoicomonas haliclonae TaxID=1960125 RepID=A0A1X7AEX0_9GAMM|nr:DUF971 domain-containing protein [Parendozoicomonas haliclonae]SMA35732.1 hypothetical protein EHSB41UT_00560 [Parendozoicomonas haliclonae]
MSAFIPNKINLHKKSCELELGYLDGRNWRLSCEYLRVFSPSAEVRGHGVGQDVLQTGKMHVSLKAIEPVGNYGLKLIFDDGHDSGIYTWEYLCELGEKQDENWQDYLGRLEEAQASRDPDVSVVRLL